MGKWVCENQPTFLPLTSFTRQGLQSELGLVGQGKLLLDADPKTELPYFHVTLLSYGPT